MSVDDSVHLGRVGEDTKAHSLKIAANPGVTISEPKAYNAWLRAKVHEAIDDPAPAIPHDQVMREAEAMISQKRHTRP